MTENEPNVITCAVRLNPSLYRTLKKEAGRKHTGMSTLIRQAVAELLNKQNNNKHTNDDFAEFLELYKTFKNSMK